MLPIFDALARRQREEEERNARIDLRNERRLLRQDSNPFLLPANQFVELYRLNKESVRNLINILRPHLTEPVYTTGISIETKVFAALRFYATGAYQRSVGEEYHVGLSQSAIHR